MICDEKRPTPEIVEKAWNHNDHGGGVAWRENNKAGKPIVRWEKGLDLKEMQDYCKNLPLPFIAHFRIASVGGRLEDLCHPFEIGANASVKLSGETGRGVLFHNGTWGQWRSFSLEFATKRPGITIPVGAWSDTRAMAWIASYIGDGVLEFINEKTVVYGPKHLQIFGDGWEEVEGITMSNKFFLNSFRKQQNAYSGHSGGSTVVSAVQNSGSSGSSESRYTGDRPDITVITKEEKAGGLSHDITFRGSIEVIPCREAVKEQVEEVSKAEGKGTGEGVQGTADKTVVMGPKLSESDVKTISTWSEASSKNPKRFSGHTPIITNDDAEADDAKRHRRIDATRRGISYLGRM